MQNVVDQVLLGIDAAKGSTKPRTIRSGSILLIRSLLRPRPSSRSDFPRILTSPS